MENQSNSIESQVMGRITSGRVKLRSRYIFLAERVAFGSAILFGALGAALIFSLVFFYLRETEVLKYFVFGSDGVYAFLEAFPFGAVISFVLLSFITALLFRKTEITYKKPFIFIVGFLLLFIVGTGFAFAKTRAMDALEAASYRENFAGKMMRPFFGRGGGMRAFGVVGRVREIKDDIVLVQTPEGVREIRLEDMILKRAELVPGAFIMGVGGRVREGERFVMKKFRVLSESEARMMRRGVHRMFDRDERDDEIK